MSDVQSGCNGGESPTTDPDFDRIDDDDDDHCVSEPEPEPRNLEPDHVTTTESDARTQSRRTTRMDVKNRRRAKQRGGGGGGRRDGGEGGSKIPDRTPYLDLLRLSDFCPDGFPVIRLTYVRTFINCMTSSKSYVLDTSSTIGLTSSSASPW